jgi:hypothetical protein
VAGVLGCPPASAGQSLADRAALAAWADSLASATTAASLTRYDARAHRGAGDAGDIRLALFQLRKAELTSDRGLTELALIRLNAVGASHRSWPWPDYLTARTFFWLSDQNAPVILSAGLIEGESHVEAAWRHLHQSISTDSGFSPARSLALHVLAAEGDRELRGDERALLHLLLRRRNPEPAALLVAARDFRTHRRHDSALVMLDRAVAAHGDLATLQLERARTLHALGDTLQARLAYWDGIAHLTPAGREMYRHDLAWIMPPDSLVLFDRIPDDSVSDWMYRVWAQRDAEAANRPGERLQEHFRRWTYAFDHYRVASPWRHNQFARVEYGFEGVDRCIGSDSELYELLAREQPAHPGDVRHREPLLDNRGLIYLHHGAPYQIVYGPGHPFTSDTSNATPTTTLATDLPIDTIPPASDPALECAHMAKDTLLPVGPNEAWKYWIGGQWRVLNFRGSCALGRYAATTLTSYLPISPATSGDWLARAELLPEYHEAALQIAAYVSKFQHVVPMTCLNGVQSVVALSRADADVAVRTDSHTPLIRRPWGAVIQAFALGSGVDQSGEGLVTFAIPIDSLHAARVPNGKLVYNLTARIVGYDRASGRMFTIDSMREITAPKQAGAQAHLSGWFEFALDAGDWEVAVRMNQGLDSTGAYALAPHIKVDAGTTLSLSDLVTGSVNGLDWPAPDGSSFPLNVLGAWENGGTAEVYYQVNGLNANDAYHAVVEVRPLEPTAKESKDVVHVESTDRATGPVTTVRKSLGLAQLKPGIYRLIVSVDAGARHAEREQHVLVLQRK